MNVEVRVVSDLIPAYEASSVEVALYRGMPNENGGAIGATERVLNADEPLARGLWVVTFEGLSPGVYTFLVELKRASGAVLAKRPLSVTVSDDASYTVSLTADCARVECPAAGASASLSACIAGVCADPRCTPETPEHCPPDVRLFCDGDSDCTPRTTCARATCIGGSCIDEAIESECGTGEFCSSLSGCTLSDPPANAPPMGEGLCGAPCTIAASPCQYAYYLCDATHDEECVAVSLRPEGFPCPNGGRCDAQGVCVENVRSDGGVPDASVLDMGVALDMDVTLDMDVPFDTGVAPDAGPEAGTPCASGYAGTVETGCVDIDECAVDNGGCDALVGCTNTPGSRLCGECPSGYIGTGARGCFDINECTYNVCDRLTSCTNTPGGYTCSACPSGYSGDGASGCGDLNECDLAPCAEGTRCANTVGGYACSACPSGTTSDGSAAACFDVDECALGMDMCTDAQRCENRDGSYECVAITSLSLGSLHSCAVRDGRVHCWGHNGGTLWSGEEALGYGDSVNRTSPGGALSFGSDVSIRSVSAGGRFTCAVADDGAVFCWGSNGSGQLGLGDNDSRSMPTRVPGLSAVTAVSTGSGHTCAVHEDGSVSCWGANWLGQLGYGDRLDRDVPPGESVDLGGHAALSVDAGDSDYAPKCALLDDGSVRCWGYEFGSDNIVYETPVPIALGAGRTARKVVVGGSHACVLLDDASVKCWGDNYEGQLGYGGNAPRPRLTSATVNLGTRRVAKDVVAGGSHTCALLDDNTVKCWGANSGGQLGDGSVYARDLPGDPIDFGERHAVAISAGDVHTCAVLDDGAVFCWGNHSFGAVGVGLTAAVWAPRAEAIDVGGDVVDVAAGWEGTCAVVDGGGLKCWGGNGRGDLTYGGQLGYGDAVDSDAPREAFVPLDPNDVVTKVAASHRHVCALFEDGTVKCWGYNASGQLGYGDSRSRSAPERDPDTTDDTVLPSDESFGYAIDIAVGTEHSCAILEDGNVKCWGRNNHGQLGYGNTSTRNAPDYDVVNLGAGRTAIALALGWSHSCALLDDHSVKCWGSNDEGQLGVGDTTNRMAPTASPINLGAGRTAKAISAGAYHTCAILDNDTLKCWGGNGQIGLPSSRELSPPADPLDFGAGRTVRDVAVGGSFTCVLLDDDSVKCWGQNGMGQLGYGDDLFRRLITNETLDFGPTRTVVGLRAGSSHACAIFDDASLRCWGTNVSGQLGLGFSGTIATPSGPLVFP